MIDYKYKYLKYKKKYQKAGALVARIQNIYDEISLHFNIYNTTINICGGCTFKQYKFGNRLITLIGEIHDSDFIQNESQLKKIKDTDISVAEYVLAALKSNPNAKVVIENNVFTPFIDKITSGSRALTQIPLFLNGEGMCNRSTNIDWRCYFLSSKFINKSISYTESKSNY